jgi:hypothetical protein
MLVLSSPKRENYRKLLKALGATIRYMPIWSWAEIEACHALLYSDDPTRPLADVSAAFERWGGVPRFVLEKLRDEAAQLSLQDAIDTAKLGVIQSSVGQVDSAPEASHRLLHILTQRPYVRKSVTFGTQHILDQLTTRFLTLQARGMMTFLVSSAFSSQLATVRGDLFEAYAHRVLCSGGDFCVRCLSGRGAVAVAVDTMLQLPRSTGVHPVQRPEDLALCPSADDYCQPVIRNFPAVDGVKLPGFLFQMTVSTTHNIKHAALKTVLAQLPDAPQYDLYFVVPEDIYHEYAAQKFVGTDDKEMTNLDARVQRVQQWALCIPLHGPLSRDGVAPPSEPPRRPPVALPKEMTRAPTTKGRRRTKQPAAPGAMLPCRITRSSLQLPLRCSSASGPRRAPMLVPWRLTGRVPWPLPQQLFTAGGSVVRMRVA